MTQLDGNTRIFVQFAPCGHTTEVTLAAYLEMEGGSQAQLDRIEAGEKLDAPILPSKVCPECNTPVSSEIANLYAQDDLFRARQEASRPADHSMCGRDFYCRDWPMCQYP